MLSRSCIQMGEDPLDGLGILETGDGPHRLTPDWTGLDVNIEHPLKQLRPHHRGAQFGRCRSIQIRTRGMLAGAALLGRCRPRAVVELLRIQ